MRLTLRAPSQTSPAVSEKTLLTLSKVVLFIAITLLPAVSAQDVTVSLRQNSTAFSDSEDEFERICRYQGSSPQFDHLEWLLNETVNKTGVSEATSLQLLIQSVTFSHAGRWDCRAVFSDGTAPIVVNAGTLTVFDPNDITAPSEQYALVDQPYTLQCSSVIARAFIAWLRNDQILSTGAQISTVQLSDEGVYECRVSAMGASIEKPVQLNVIVPPRIFSVPQFEQSFSNEQVTLTVTFQSHQNSTTRVRWFKNNIPISSTNITTRYGSTPNATTELRFEQITRENRGRYHVEIENTAEVIPANMRMAVSTFDVDVQVPPSRPTGVTITRLNDTHVWIRWTLTNQTVDAGAEILTIHLQDHPNSPFQLQPNQEEWIFCSEPGMMYNLTLKAANPDGEVATDPMAVKLPPTAPAVERFQALRVNDTAFNFTLEVAYTGGGGIQQFSIRLQQSGSSTLTPIATVTPVQSQTSPRLWYAVVKDSRFNRSEEPRFDITIVNAMEQSVVQRVQGEVVLPGPPSILLVSQSSDSLTLQIQLSDVGTAPILTVEMNVTLASQLIDTMEWTGSFSQGELIDVTVTDLQPNTVYTFRTRAMNVHGTGNISIVFTFTTSEPPSEPMLPPWAIIAIAVGGSVVLTVLCVTVILCLICCCKRSYTEKYCTGSEPYPGTIGAMPVELKTSAETLNSTSHRGSVRGGVIGNYTSVPLTPRSPTIESCDSPYIKQRFESVTDSDGSRSDIHVHQQYTPYRHYTYSHSPGPSGTVPASLKLNHNERLSRSLTAFDEPTSPQDITHQATMV